MIEVFTRGWVAQLIDHGVPYAERAAELKIDFKFDLGVVRAIHGRVVTMGDMLAHSIQLNSFGQVCDVFNALLGEKLVPLISQAFDTRRSLAAIMTIEPITTGPPIIKDASARCRRLSRLFETRHILCHEFPRKGVYDRAEITMFLNAASEFALATNEVLGPYFAG